MLVKAVAHHIFRFAIITCCSLFFVIFPQGAVAQDAGFEIMEDEEVFEARVEEVLEQKEMTRENGSKAVLQKLKLKGLEGERKGQEIIFDGTEIDVFAQHVYRRGDKVLVSVSKDVDGNDRYYVTDFVRRGSLYVLAAIFVLFILLIGRWRGLRALLGLVFSFVVILKLIIPSIMAGNNPLSVTLAYALLIIVVSTYLVYGLNKKSTVAVIGTFSGIVIVGAFSVLFTNSARLAGFAQEETVYVVGLMGGTLDLRGLLLAGFVIGALGVLDDITISQVSAVREIYETNPRLARKEIYRKAMRIGVDHIASMVNTLFLAYAGASFSLLLLFTFRQAPFLTFSQVVNNEIIATEIVRTLVGSIGLALAVPITTWLASFSYQKKIYGETAKNEMR